ncbi:MAG: DUF4340 domain-containing protein [Firmicutes bacterium]|nr:DUF4340 domain-containing protein [Bacillota bacterium]
MIKKQVTLIVVLAVIFAALICVYFFIVAPLTADDEEEDTDIETLADEGSEYGAYLLMFEHVERAEMQSIEVKNDYGTYKFVRDEDDDFVLEGYENLAYDEELFSELVVAAGMSICLSRLTTDPTEEELETYGFTGTDDEGNEVDPSYYIVTTTEGVEHKVIIGRRILSSGGYYAMYEGRSTVYVLSSYSSIEETLLAPVTDLISPILTAGLSTTSYYLIDNFSIQHYGEEFISCRTLTDEEQEEEESTAIVSFKSIYPAEYPLSTNYDTVLQTLCYYTGESVVALDLSDENMETYGLSDAPYTITYDMSSYTYTLIASELTDDGYYYISTSLFNVIIKVPAADFEFLSYSLLDWIDVNVFGRNITYVSTLEVYSPSFSETFRLTHYEDEDPNLVVIGDECGEIDDVYNFRQLYVTLLLMQVEDEAANDTYAPDDIESIITEDNLVASFTVTTIGGNVTEYAFYRYSTRHCLLTINGSGQFYVIIDTPNKIISDAYKVTIGEEVDGYAKN